MTADELAAILATEAAVSGGVPLWARFDAAFYRAANPTLGLPAEAPDDALLRHYLQVGRFQSRSPNPWFDEVWYLARHLEVAGLVAAGQHGIQSGFEHYLLLGHAALSPHWLFDAAHYRQHVSDYTIAANGDTDAYAHYLRAGARRGIAAHAMFDPAFYTAANAVAAKSLPAEGAFGHYLTRLWRDGFEGWTAPGFDLTAARLDPACAAAIARGEAQAALHHALAAGTPHTHAAATAATLRQTIVAPSAADGGIEPSAADGGIDMLVLHEGAAGWFLAGRLASPRPDTSPDIATNTPAFPPQAPLIALRHTDGIHAAYPAIAWFPRNDLGDRGLGFVAFVPGAEGPAHGEVQRVGIVAGDLAWDLPIPAYLRAAPAAQIMPDLRQLIDRLEPSDAAAALRRALAHPAPDGSNTMGQLPERVFFELDEAMALPGGDLILTGWHLARPGAVRAMRLRRGWRSRPIRLDEGIAIERPDVRDSVGRDTGLVQLRCGFMLRIPRVFDPSGPAVPEPCIEIEMTSGAIAQRGITLGNRAGMDAIRYLLDRADPPFGDAATPFDRVIGPAVAAAQTGRMARAVPVRRHDFGRPPAAPRVSVIVTLYGRVDFLDYQLGIEAAQAARRNLPPPDIERLYVLDDPPRARATEALAVQAHLRFALPFSLLTPEENRGFAGANNIGLRAARGRYICFLNSDVFPGTPDWASRLADRLDADPTLGAVAPRLLYEDGSIQHDGMVFQRIPRIGAWRFPDHPGKGMRPPDPSQPGAGGLHDVVAATGACLMLRRDLALALGGFDEAYPIGDFEDADLCMKLRGLGLRIAVDRDITLFHLERQSQAGSAEHWRMQLTLFNAWQHEQRWARLLDRYEIEPSSRRAEPAA